MDHGQTEWEKLGWWAWLTGKRARRIIVREADLEAALQSLPEGATASVLDLNGNYIVYTLRDGEQRIRFRASAAWLPNEPTILENKTPDTGVTILLDGRILVFEGLHRTRAMARDRLTVPSKLAASNKHPDGWISCWILIVEFNRAVPLNLVHRRRQSPQNDGVST